MIFTFGGFKTSGSYGSPSPDTVLSIAAGSPLIAEARLDPISMAAAAETEDHFCSNDLPFIEWGFSALKVFSQFEGANSILFVGRDLW